MIVLVCLRVVTSYDGSHISHVRLQAMGVVQGVVLNPFRRRCDQVDW